MLAIHLSGGEKANSTSLGALRAALRRLYLPRTVFTEDLRPGVLCPIANSPVNWCPSCYRLNFFLTDAKKPLHIIADVDVATLVTPGGPVG